MTDAAVDRERAALEAILDALLPRIQAGLLFYQVWGYRVIGTNDGPPVTVNAKSQDPRMPDLSKIVLRQGPDGGYATPAQGSLIGVAFLNADPSMPYVHSLDPTTKPNHAWLAGGGPAAARVGDPVNCGYMVFTSAVPLTISNGQYFPGNPAGKAAADALVTSLGGSAFRFDLNIPSTTPITGGVITGGSAEVDIGP